MRRKWTPSSRLITAFALLSAAVFINAFSKSYFNAGLDDYLPAVLFGGLITIALLDFMLSRRLPPVEIKREVAGNLAVDKWAPVKLRIKHNFAQPTQITIFDGVPGSAGREGASGGVASS